MIARYLFAPIVALPLLAAPLAAQSSIDRAAPSPARPLVHAPETTAPGAPTSAASLLAPLQLRGGATPTGLHGFYDYQSNGGSPEYIDIRPGSWSNIYTVFMNSTSGASVTEASSTRRVGYAYSSDGGATWQSNREIATDRLGYPDIEVSAEPVPYIAAHGDFGAGNQIVIYANPTPAQPNAFIPLGEMPVTASNDLGDRGVIWPSFELAADGSRGYVAAAYFSDADHPALPMQVGSIDLASGAGPQKWSAIPDSVHSTTSGGRYVLARSAGGKLGVAWFRYALFEGDTEYGVYYSESTDGGTTWSAPQGVLVGEIEVTGFDINGDTDTLTAGPNIDGTYIGEELNLTFTGSMNALLQFQNVLYWSPSRGLQMVSLAHQVPGLGAFGLATELRQENMGTIAYPTITTSEDGQKIVIAFQAVDQRYDAENDILTSAASEAGFLYYRIWAVGSADGGRNWGTPFIVQDLAGDGSDSASVEYPSLAPVSRMVGNDLELNLVFQGRRQPGQFAFSGADQTPGAIEDVHQYFQRFAVTPEMFLSTSSVDKDVARTRGLELASVAPNPASERISIAYRTDRVGDVSVRMYDHLGRVVADGSRSARQPGLHTETLDVSQLPAGAYRVVVETGGVTSSLPVVVR